MSRSPSIVTTFADAAAFGAHTLVPTMGALHEGHAALIRLGAKIAAERGLAGGCVASVFVNPAQFNDPSDFEMYPRAIDRDATLAFEAGATVVLAPSVDEVYPAGDRGPAIAVPAVGTEPGLEDRHRPGHFEGVCRVLVRFFDELRSVVAVFGEKDWQQLAVVRAMVADRGGPEIVALPTVRESGGLAMSSRNARLTPAERELALGVPSALRAAQLESTPQGAEAAMRRVLRGYGLEPEYAVVRDAGTLLESGDGPARALIAVPVGRARLIDNDAWHGKGRGSSS